MKILYTALLFATLLFAIDWSERSTQELIAALQSADSANVPVILHELKKREPAMTPEEKKAYEKAREKPKDAR